MATGFPASTGDILTAAAFNGLVAYTVNADATTDYTAVLADAYQAVSYTHLTLPTNREV